MVLAPFLLLINWGDDASAAIIGFGVVFATSCATIVNLYQAKYVPKHSMNWQSTKEILGTFSGSLAGAPLSAWLYGNYGLEWLQLLIGGVIGGLTIYFWRK